MNTELDSLLKRIKSGDDLAFNRLTEMYTGLTEGTVRRFASSLGLQAGVPQTVAAADPEELRQDAIMALYKAAMSYDPLGDGQKVSFGLYAKICMNNAMISKVRKYKRMLRRMEKRSRVEDAKEHFPDMVSQQIDLEALSESLKYAVNSLSAYERKVFDLYVHGKSTGEIAKELNRPEKSVSNACYRVKTKIKGLLKNQGNGE